MRILYNILAYLAMPFVLIRLLIRAFRMPAYRQHIAQRFGFVPKSDVSCIWFHAVSVGESIAAVPLIKRCLEEYPDYRIVVTNTTPTGRDRIQAALREAVENYYMPYDLSGALQRFMGRVLPKLLVLMETELWPNLLHYAKCQQVKVVLANARLSERSATGYAAYSSLTKGMFNSLDFVAVQAAADQERFIMLGVPEDKIETVGSVKYDISIDESMLIKAAELRVQIGMDRPVWVASSTHEGEEEQVIAAHKLVLEEYPTAALILVPRHPNRFNTVADLLAKQSWNVVRQSGEVNCNTESHVLLGDTMGEMLLFLAASDVVFVAGSFVPIGGHNTMEPAVLAKPILQGPYWHNFAESTRLLAESSAIIEVHDGKELAKRIVSLFADKVEAGAMGQRAKAVVDANRGSTEKQFAIIRSFLG